MDVGTVLGLGIGAIGALAACAAIGYAHSTVRQGRAGQREAHQWRQEDLKERNRERADAAQAHDEHIAELRRLQAISNAAHEQQMAQRQTAAESEMHLARVRALENLVDALVALVTRAQEESINPPPPRGLHSPFRQTLLPTILSRVKAAAAVYAALGCPELEAVGRIVDSYVMASDDPISWIRLGVTALGALEQTSRQHPAFQPGDHGATRPVVGR